jgi:hypothetical protein
MNLKSTRILFNVSATTSNAQAARLPNDTRSFIDRMAIYMGGVLVQNSFSNYNVLVHAQKALGADRCTDTTLTHQEIVRVKSYHDGSTLTDKEEYTTPDVQLAITDFLGFLQADPSIIDTGLFPQITVEITLADNVICPSIAVANNTALATTSKTGGICETSGVGSSYSITDMTMQVEVLGMASSMLDEVVAQRISQVGYLSIPFPNYFSFSSTHNTTSRFNINSSSWNKLWVCWRDPANATAQAPQVVAGHKIAGAFVSAATATQVAAANTSLTTAATAVALAITQDMGKPQYDIGGTYNTNSERYIARFFNFEERNATPTTTPTNMQLQLNGANYPAYKLTVPEVYALTMNSIDIYDKSRMMSLDQYRKNFFVQCYRFDLPESSYSRNLSGLDTRASSAQCAMVTENMIADTTCFMFCECTSELRVANRAIEVIV